MQHRRALITLAAAALIAGCGDPSTGDIEASLKAAFNDARGKQINRADRAECLEPDSPINPAPDDHFRCVVQVPTGLPGALGYAEWNYDVKVNDNGCWRTTLRDEAIDRAGRKYQVPVRRLKGCVE